MFKKSGHCKNLNHGKMLVSVQYCSMCGDRFNVQTNSTHCTEANHAIRRKNRDIYCFDCGLNYTTNKKKSV